MLRSTHTVFAPVAGRRLVAHVSIYRRLGSVSVVATGPLGATQAVGRRWYSSYSSSSQGGSQQSQQHSAPPGATYQQQPTPAGAPLYPMPPPPYAMPQFVYAMPPPHMQSAGMSAPPLPDIGSPDRPMYVKSVAPPRGFQHYLMLFFFSFIAASALLNIVEQLEARNAPPMRPGGGGGGGSNRLAQSLFGSSDVAPVDLDSTNVTFADIQGCDEAKEELKEIVMFLKDPKKFHEMGAKLPKGALLVGPPGTGKTMLAKAIAKESGVKFFYANGSEFDEMFVGVGSRRVRELFAAAKANGPALIFIDEIDSLAGKRSSKDMSYSRMTLNQLLAEMDGFKSNEEIVVIAATNTPDVLDKALTRPGRFDTTIAVDPPDMKGRAAIAETYLKKIKRDIGVTADKIARATTGFTGAELANLINVAAIRAVVLGKGTVGEEEIEYAKDRVMMGSENRSKKIPEDERRITAYHEGGHALVALLLEKDGADPVHKATIIPRGSGIMGLVQQQAAEDKYSNSRRGMLSRLKVCLAGRVAEELILGSEDVTTGASSDFQQATRLARAMVRRFGFNDGLGTVDYDSAESAEGAYISDATKQRIESEVQQLVTTAYKDAVKMLSENRPALDAIAQNLLAHETLSGEQLKAIVAGKPLPERFSAAPASASAGTPPPPPPPSGGLAVTIGKKAAATTTPPAKTPAAGQA